jgi:hypothetical protein
MFVLRRLDVFQPGQFIGEIRWLVDEHRQALRADENDLALIMQRNKWNLLFGFLTVQAGFHLVSCKIPFQTVKAWAAL